MADELVRRWDDAVETAWREFRQRLADRIAEMDSDVWFTVSAWEGRERIPLSRVRTTGGLLRVEILRDDTVEEGCWIKGDHIDQAAVTMVTLLRIKHGVLHPNYLDADGLEPQRTGFKPLPPDPVRPTLVQPDLDRVHRPASADDVRALIDVAIGGLYDEAPGWDDDGDLPLPAGEQIVWVLVGKTASRVLLTCLLVDGVDDEETALAEVNRLNLSEFGLSFFLADRRISVTREIGLSATTPALVQFELRRLLTQVDGWAHDLVQRLSTAAEPEPPVERKSSRFATAYSIVAELEREERGSVGPAMMVRVFDSDTGLLLKAIRITEQRRRELRGKVREARTLKQRNKENVLRARHDYLRDLTARMRAALRLIVDAPVRKVQLDQLALFDEDEAGTGR